MQVELLNGGSNTVNPMQGSNSVLPMNGGTGRINPLNGSNTVVPMQGSSGLVYYVAPISIMDIRDVPTNWIPTDLTAEEILLLKTAYMMGDQRALNGLFGDILKGAIKGGTAIGNAVNRAVTNVVASTIKDEDKREAFVTGTAVQNQALLAKINPQLAAKEAQRIAVTVIPNNSTKQAEAAKIAKQSAEELASVGIQADPKIIAERAVMAADLGVKSADAGIMAQIQNYWANASTPKKLITVGVGMALVYGGYKGYQYYFGKPTRKKK